MPVGGLLLENNDEGLSLRELIAGGKSQLVCMNEYLANNRTWLVLMEACT